jgi:hypothetical protein
MKTVVTEILEHCKELLSEGHQIDTQGLVDWIEDTLLEMEKEQIRDAFNAGDLDSDTYFIPFLKENDESENYYNETFKSE